MTHQLSLADRIRIERVAWSLDQRLYDLPRSRRIAVRREVRDNLRTAAADLGAGRAVRNIGSIGELADSYLDAQYGTRRRPSWIAAALFGFTALLVLQALLTDAALGFRDGVLAGNPAFTGARHWSGVSLLQNEVTVVISDHSTAVRGGALSPWAWLLLVAGSVAIGRLWRALPARKSRVEPT